MGGRYFYIKATRLLFSCGEAYACHNRVEVYFQFYKPVENKGTDVSRRQLRPASPPAVVNFKKAYAGEKGEEGDEPRPKPPALKAGEAGKEKKRQSDSQGLANNHIRKSQKKEAGNQA
jgi:hypothetical protein